MEITLQAILSNFGIKKQPINPTSSKKTRIKNILVRHRGP
jgi:hypothetical protein